MPNLSDLLALPRPEYAKQVELVLVDLLWNSPGTTLGEARAIRGLNARRSAPGEPTRRLVLEAVGGRSPEITETIGWVREASATFFRTSEEAERFTSAAMASIMAPRSRMDRSRTCVPVHRGVIPLQTLHGAVNKDAPPDLARAVEVMAALGGADSDGRAAQMLARAFDDTGNSDVDEYFERLAPFVWEKEQNANIPDWPSQLARHEELPRPRTAAVAGGPPDWFWRNWSRLLDPSNGWRRALPERRFADWGTCLLRTGLALTYLWEGAVFRALRDFHFERSQEAWERLRRAFESPALLRIHASAVPWAERNITQLLNAGLGDGYFARVAFDEAVVAGHDENVGGFRFELHEDAEAVARRLALVRIEEARAYRDPRQAPKTLREFVRYLLLARSSNDAPAEEADFYYLARSDRKRMWVEPGPEWLVVVASLAAGTPGSQCKLRDVALELRSLGIQVDRSTLVGMLEAVGLTQDSPDADEAIIVHAGF